MITIILIVVCCICFYCLYYSYYSIIPGIYYLYISKKKKDAENKKKLECSPTNKDNIISCQKLISDYNMFFDKDKIYYFNKFNNNNNNFTASNVNCTYNETNKSYDCLLEKLGTWVCNETNNSVNSIKTNDNIVYNIVPGSNTTCENSRTIQQNACKNYYNNKSFNNLKYGSDTGLTFKTNNGVCLVNSLQYKKDIQDKKSDKLINALQETKIVNSDIITNAMNLAN